MATYTFDKINYGGNTYVVSDSGALQLTGGQVTGPVTFGDSITVDEATLGDLVVNGSASFTNNIQANTLNGQAINFLEKSYTNSEFSGTVGWQTQPGGAILSINSGTTTSSVGGSGIFLDHTDSDTLYEFSISYAGFKFSEGGNIISVPSGVGGTIALTSDLLKSKTVSLANTGWSSNTKTVSVSGITASNTVIVSPAPASYDAYCECGIYCSAQAAGSLTFTCDTVPSSTLTVNVLYR